VTLTKDDGVCVASASDGVTSGVFSCDGTLTLAAESFSWTADGSGGFAFELQIVNPGATSQPSWNVTCDPS
jgi:hypothetical protein